MLEIAVTDTGAVRSDRSRLEQVLLNTGANARDAMPRWRAALDRIGPGEPPGEFVRLTVRDTGEGMDDDVRAHLFEPFFTTKPRAKGTGLGLLPCTEVVKQSGGHIPRGVCARRGHRHARSAARKRRGPTTGAPHRDRPLPLPRGEGTVLLVEDNDGVRLSSLRRSSSAVATTSSRRKTALRRCC